MSETSGFVYDMARVIADDSFQVLETIGSGGKFVLFDGSGQLRQAQAFVSGRMPAVGFVTDDALSGTNPLTTFLGKLFKRPNILGAAGDTARFQEFVGASGGIATFYDSASNIEAGPVEGATPAVAAGTVSLAIDQSVTIQTSSGLAYLLKHPERMQKVDDDSGRSYSPGAPTMPPVMVRAFSVFREFPTGGFAAGSEVGVAFCSGGTNSFTRFSNPGGTNTSGRGPAMGITLNTQAAASATSGRSAFIASKVVRAISLPISGIAPVGSKVYIGRTNAPVVAAVGVLSNGVLSGGFSSFDSIQPIGVVIASGGYAVINVKPICFSGYFPPYT
jgi:hypothetical protein